MTDKDKLEEILEQPLACVDGQSHHLDESQRRYLARIIRELFAPKPSKDKEKEGD